MIKNKYSSHDYFISRPMKAVGEETSNNLTRLLKDIDKYGKVSIYYAGKDYDFGESISSYRIGTIKRCNVFILIYPKIQVTQSPASSCLIELGAALAEHKRIILIVEEGALLPEFFNDLKESRVEYCEYTCQKELGTILKNIFNNEDIEPKM